MGRSVIMRDRLAAVCPKSAEVIGWSGVRRPREQPNPSSIRGRPEDQTNKLAIHIVQVEGKGVYRD